MRLERAAWNDSAALFLRPALGSDEEIIKNQVNSGMAVLWLVIGCGWLVTRLDGDELVFVAGVGKNAKEVIRLFMKNKKQLNFKTCRIHSARAGMGRYLETLGFKEVERVFQAVA